MGFRETARFALSILAGDGRECQCWDACAGRGGLIGLGSALVQQSVVTCC
jgi:hypothetical protein